MPLGWGWLNIRKVLIRNIDLVENSSQEAKDRESRFLSEVPLNLCHSPSRGSGRGKVLLSPSFSPPQRLNLHAPLLIGFLCLENSPFSSVYANLTSPLTPGVPLHPQRCRNADLSYLRHEIMPCGPSLCCQHWPQSAQFNKTTSLGVYSPVSFSAGTYTRAGSFIQAHIVHPTYLLGLFTNILVCSFEVS